MSTIGVVFGGPAPEHDISILTGLQASRLLAGAGHDVVALYWSRSAEWFRVEPGLEGPDFVPGVPERAVPLALRVPGGFTERRRMREAALEVDVAVNCCHGGPGESGALTAMLMLAGLRVTGPGPEACSWVMDKVAASGIAELAGIERFGIEAIPTVPVSETTTGIPLEGPWVVKPRFGGSSLGIEVGVEDVETVVALCRTGERRAGAVAQPLLDGWMDLNVAVRAHPAGEVSAIEKPIASGIYSYQEKYLQGADGMESARRKLPADLPGDVAERVRAAAAAIARTVGLSGVPRVDFLFDGTGRLAFCEVNAIPGSLGLYLWEASGHPRAAILEDLVDEARKAPVSPPHWAAVTDGAALRSAATIASKLR